MSTIDCRTCRSGTEVGCFSAAQCVDGNLYAPSTPRQYWKRSSLLALGGMLRTGAPAVPVEAMSIGAPDCRTCTSRAWSGSGQSHDCNAAAGMPLPDSHHDGQRPGWCPKEPHHYTPDL